jgi:hypothetical protein
MAKPTAARRCCINRWQAVSGAIGGGFDLIAIPIELPAASAIIMLRLIMQIARSQGEEIENPETALSCLQVFALGARTGEGDVLDNGYFAACTALQPLTDQARDDVGRAAGRNSHDQTYRPRRRPSMSLALIPLQRNTL